MTKSLSRVTLLWASLLDKLQSLVQFDRFDITHDLTACDGCEE